MPGTRQVLHKTTIFVVTVLVEKSNGWEGRECKPSEEVDYRGT